MNNYFEVVCYLAIELIDMQVSILYESSNENNTPITIGHFHFLYNNYLRKQHYTNICITRNRGHAMS